MKKKIIGIVLTVLLVLSLSLAVYAGGAGGPSGGGISPPIIENATQPLPPVCDEIPEE